jgi:hypothetical protein
LSQELLLFFSFEKVLAAHGLQLDWVGSSLYSPGMQGKHKLLPALSWWNPMGQPLQLSSLLLSVNVPTKQTRHGI